MKLIYISSKHTFHILIIPSCTSQGRVATCKTSTLPHDTLLLNISNCWVTWTVGFSTDAVSCRLHYESWPQHVQPFGLLDSSYVPQLQKQPPRWQEVPTIPQFTPPLIPSRISLSSNSALSFTNASLSFFLSIQFLALFFLWKKENHNFSAWKAWV